MCDSIDDYLYDEVCLNCIYWIVNDMGCGGMICSNGKGSTNPDDSCCLFVPLKSKNYDNNNYLNKSQKLDIWKSSY